ncbi:MAG: VOC family protein [Chloroflexi bacterium]|uniref:VOC family protein n=1 Tax=Candidatus Flexifilum breve TaxID=3140694 RepID=UPI003136A204|nr:VOC family protein [Chloroflexota bacterium]
MQPRISQIRLLVTDFAGCFRFYRDILGLPVASGDETDVYASFHLTPDVGLGLFRRDLMAAVVETQAKPPKADAQDSVVIAYQVDDVDIAAGELRAKGVALVAVPTNRPDWSMRTVHFRDPDGNLVELFSGLKG